MLYHIEVDGQYPKRKRVLVRHASQREPCLFGNRKGAKQYIRNHLLGGLHPEIVPANLKGKGCPAQLYGRGSAPSDV